MRLDNAAAVKVGSQDAVAVYVGAEQVWPTGPTPNPYVAAALVDSPMALALGDQASGTTLTDLSGNGIHGTISATGVTYQDTGPTGVLPHALGFDGSTGAASIPVDLSTLGAGAEVTIEFWLQSTWDSAARVFAEYTPNFNSSNGAIFLQDPTGIIAGVSQTPVTGHRLRRLNPAPSTGSWHFWSVVWSRQSGASTLVDVRVDGALRTTVDVGSQNTTGSFASSSLHLMARGGASLRAVGRMCGIAVYPTRLTNTRRDAHYAASFP